MRRLAIALLLTSCATPVAQPPRTDPPATGVPLEADASSKARETATSPRPDATPTSLARYATQPSGEWESAGLLEAAAIFEETSKTSFPDTLKTQWTRGVSTTRLLHCRSATLEIDGGKADLKRALFAEFDDGTLVFLDGATSDELAFSSDETWTSTSVEPRILTARSHPSITIRCAGDAFEDVSLARIPDLYADYAYAVTVTRSDAELYIGPFYLGKLRKPLVPELAEEFRSQGMSLAFAFKLLRYKPAAIEAIWGDAIDWAVANGHGDLALKLHRHYEPRGRCSFDGRPVSALQHYRKTCLDEGELECAISLSLETILGDATPDYSLYSNGKPRAPDASFDDLPGPVDIPRLIRGAVVDFPGTPENARGRIAPERLGFGLRASQHRAAIRESLVRYLHDTRLDAWNRHRIALAILAIDEASGVASTDAIQRLRELPGIPAITRQAFDLRLSVREGE